MKGEPFYRFRSEAAGDEPASAELLIFAAIGDWEELGEVSAKAFARDLAKLPTSVKQLDIHINSPGGSVFEAQAIYSRLADHRSKKVVYVDGLAASAASIVAMVGHKIYIRANANMMIHLPSGFAMGNAEDMRTVAAALDSVTESMLNVYSKRSGLDREEVRALMAAETWFSPQQAVEKGFADEMRGVVKAAAIVPVAEKRVIINGVEHDLSRFHNVPAFTGTTQPITTMATQPKPKEKEEENGGGEGAGAPTAPPKEQPTPPPTSPPSGPPPNTAPAGQPNPPAAANYEDGVKAERERVSALQAMDRPATHDIITAAIKDGKQPAEVVTACIEAMDKAGKQGARRTDASALDGIPGSDAGNGEGQDNFGAKLKKAVQARMKARNRGMHVVSGRN